MNAETLCVCGDLYRRHRATLSRGAVRVLCTACDDCGGFEAMPGMPTVPAGAIPADAPTELGTEGSRTNEEAGSVGAEPDPECECDHPESRHRARIIGGRYIDACLVCECTQFAAVPVFSVDEIFPPERVPIYAWDALLCSSCEWRTSAPDLMARKDAACLQCGSRMVPVRIEMYEREGG